MAVSSSPVCGSAIPSSQSLEHTAAAIASLQLNMSNHFISSTTSRLRFGLLDRKASGHMLLLWHHHHAPIDTQRRNSSSRSVVTVKAAVKRSPKRLKYSIQGGRKVSEVLYLQVDPSGYDAWRLDPILQLLKEGAVGVIPTDTVYALVCDLNNRAAIVRMYRIKNMDAKKPLSILCRSFKDIDKYTTGFPRGNGQGQTNVFRSARQCLPGPYTFILPTSKDMPKQCTMFGGSIAISCVPRKSVGVRMPDDAICMAILSSLDGPLICTSVRAASDDTWMLDPAQIADTYGVSEGKEGIDFVVDGGVRPADPSTVVDMTGDKPVLLRRGKGIMENWMLMEPDDSTQTAEVGLLNPYAF